MTRGLGLLPLALVAGCAGHVETSFVLTGAHAAPHGAGVYLVPEGSPIPPGFEETALVEARGAGESGEADELLAGLRDVSRRLGCTHVVRVRVDRGVSHGSAHGVCGRVRMQ